MPSFPLYASISGKAQTEATRAGTKDSNISGHIRGWNVGVKVLGSVRSNGKVTFSIYKTAGSNGGAHDEWLMDINEED